MRRKARNRNFWRSNIFSILFVRKGSPDALQIAILLQFLAIEPHFVRKGCAGRFANRNFISLAIEPHFVRKGCSRTSANQNRSFTSVFGDRTSFRAKGLHSDKRKLKITILLQFLAIEHHFVRKGCDGQREIAILLQFLAIEPHFVRKGCDGQREIAILLQFLVIEPHFVRKGCVSCRLVGTAPRLQERNRKKGESKRAREQEGKRECKDVKMRR